MYRISVVCVCGGRVIREGKHSIKRLTLQDEQCNTVAMKYGTSVGSAVASRASHPTKW